MSSKPTTSSTKSKRVPVFVFPEELQFVRGDQSSHKQVLTLYNPYDFNIKFEVLSTAPKKYAVVESKGFIKAHCCVDIVIRHLTAEAEGEGEAKDKFRVDIYYEKRLIGRKLVPSILTNSTSTIGSDPVREQDAEGFRTVPPLHQLSQRTAAAASVDPSPSLWLVVMALLCLLVLLLPLEGDSPTWPSYLHITVNQKLIAAFALGLVTMAILKS